MGLSVSHHASHVRHHDWWYWAFFDKGWMLTLGLRSNFGIMYINWSHFSLFTHISCDRVREMQLTYSGMYWDFITTMLKQNLAQCAAANPLQVWYPSLNFVFPPFFEKEGRCLPRFLFSLPHLRVSFEVAWSLNLSLFFATVPDTSPPLRSPIYTGKRLEFYPVSFSAHSSPRLPTA